MTEDQRLHDQQPDHRPTIVVMLDDNPDDVDIMAIASHELDHIELVGTDDPLAVLPSLRDAATRGSTAALLLDWHLPNDVSSELLAAIRSEALVAGTYVVVNTGSDDPADRAAALAAGADAYSVKPAGFDASIGLLSDLASRLAAPTTLEA